MCECRFAPRIKKTFQKSLEPYYAVGNVSRISINYIFPPRS